MKVGFIGLGEMGAPMALNLVEAGHQVTGYDPFEPPPQGISGAESAQAAVADVDVVITMLPDVQTLRDTAALVFPEMRRGAVFCALTTTDVDTMRMLALDARAQDLECADAPFTGGVISAREGRLAFMVGGTDETFARINPLLDVLGQTVTHCGTVGAGQAAKLINSMMLGVSMVVTCEAFALADKLGLDRQKMYEIITQSSGRNWCIEAYTPAPGVGPKTPADDNYRPGFSAEFMLNDLMTTRIAARAANADTPMGDLATDIYMLFNEQDGGAEKDFSALLPWFVARASRFTTL